MKEGEIVEIEGIRYITEKGIRKNGITCFMCSFYNTSCAKIARQTNCAKDGIIFLKIPIKFIEKIEQLEKQIERMKCCENCGNANFGENCEICKNYDKWEVKE